MVSVSKGNSSPRRKESMWEEVGGAGDRQGLVGRHRALCARLSPGSHGPKQLLQLAFWVGHPCAVVQKCAPQPVKPGPDLEDQLALLVILPWVVTVGLEHGHPAMCLTQ